MTNKLLADSHLHNKETQFTSVIGMIILISSLTMLFVALIASYGVLRVRSVNWHSHSMSYYSLSIACFNTMLILFSSYSYSTIVKHVKALNLTKTLYWINYYNIRTTKKRTYILCEKRWYKLYTI